MPAPTTAQLRSLARRVPDAQRLTLRGRLSGGIENGVFLLRAQNRLGVPTSYVLRRWSEARLHEDPKVPDRQRSLHMVPACQPCNDSKHSKPYDEWLMQRAAKNPSAPGAQEVTARIAHLREYAERFQYVVTTPESRLHAERLLRVEELRLRAKALRADVEAFLREPDA